MASRFMQLMLTPAVQAAQDRYFGRHQSVANAPERDEFTEDEAAFIAERDSFYLSTINSDGWPYIQHRGGPTGFLNCSARTSSASPTSRATASSSPLETSRATIGSRYF